ncbi:MAG: alpha/beta fold hydrolase [Lachnospiraceae bacterium]|nr:alpha/beta fold hydrolase [Lachnospiraceae bacterium]
MKFRTLGNPQNPVILCIHAMFISDEMFDTIGALLEDNYYVVLPILSGHDITEQTTFISVADEAEKIIQYLQQEHIEDIEILLGTSLGGIIAFEIFRRNTLKISKIFLDGTPFIQLSQFNIKFKAMLFKKIAHKSSKYPDKPNILDKLYPAHSTKMKKICGNMSDESIDNLAKACYTYKLPPKIILSQKQNLTFLYGTKEKAKICIPTIRKYKNCKLIIKDGYTHCGFLGKEPKRYVDMLLANN